MKEYKNMGCKIYLDSPLDFCYKKTILHPEFHAKNDITGCIFGMAR
jgi:hypothetical protein